MAPTTDPAPLGQPFSLHRTVAAIAAWDAHQAVWESCTTDAAVEAAKCTEEELGRAIGQAFGEDTADRNRLEDCQKWILRPDDWLRTLVADWKRSHGTAS